jgi:hypothetical protein
LELRQILRHGCRIIYAIDDSTVTIFAILHERRDLESTLIARQAATAPDTRRRRRNTSR